MERFCPIAGNPDQSRGFKLETRYFSLLAWTMHDLNNTTNPQGFQDIQDDPAPFYQIQFLVVIFKGTWVIEIQTEPTPGRGKHIPAIISRPAAARVQDPSRFHPFILINRPGRDQPLVASLPDAILVIRGKILDLDGQLSAHVIQEGLGDLFTGFWGGCGEGRMFPLPNIFRSTDLI